MGGGKEMPLLRDRIRIVTTPPTPQAQLGRVIRDLRAERARLARIFTTLLQIMCKICPEDVFVLKQEVNGILLELDFLLAELATGGEKR
jgi:hypothetical protein